MASRRSDAATYGEKSASFGRDYLIPRPLDQRLILEIAPAVAKAAMDSVCLQLVLSKISLHIVQKLSEFVYNSAFLMKPIFAQAKTDPKRIAYAEGEDERVLRAVQIVVDEDLAKPILVGRTAVIEANIKKLGLRLQHGVNIEIVDQEQKIRYTKSSGKTTIKPCNAKALTVEYAQR
ncbi:phosphate acyltransferase [Acinetobacter baumannii]